MLALFHPLWCVQKWPPRLTWTLRCLASTDLWWLMESCRHCGRSPVRSGWGHRTRSTMGRQSPMPWRAVTMPSCSSTTMGACKFNFFKGVSAIIYIPLQFSVLQTPQNPPFSCPMCVGKNVQSKTKTKWKTVLTKSCTIALQTHMGRRVFDWWFFCVIFIDKLAVSSFWISLLSLVSWSLCLRWVLYVNGKERITDCPAVNDGHWHHIGVSWSSEDGDWRVYIDGSPSDGGKGLSVGTFIPGVMPLFAQLPETYRMPLCHIRYKGLFILTRFQLGVNQCLHDSVNIGNQVLPSLERVAKLQRQSLNDSVTVI